MATAEICIVAKLFKFTKKKNLTSLSQETKKVIVYNSKNLLDRGVEENGYDEKSLISTFIVWGITRNATDGAQLIR